MSAPYTTNSNRSASGALSLYRDKTLLLTGGTGTFGNAVLKRALTLGFGEVRVFSRDDKKQDEMRSSLRDPEVKFHMGDVIARYTA